MIKRRKKSIETEHKINQHRNFTLSEYLALHNTEDNIIVDCESLEVNKQALVSFIDDYFLLKYTQVIDNKLALAYGVDKSYSYFDLFQYVLDLNKLVHHSKIHSLKEHGFREFYYALKNFNEVYNYKEGVFFELVYKLHKGIIKYNEVFKTIQEIILTEAEARKDHALFIAQMTDPTISESMIDMIIDKAVVIHAPDLNNKYNDHLNYLNDEIKQRSVKSSAILSANSKLNSTVLGCKEKKGLFGKETYLVEKDPFNGLVYGSPHSNERYIQNMMYQSLFNKKGFIYFNFAATGMEKYINSFAYTFNVIDEVVHIYHGTKEFYELDLNAMIRNNKIVIIQIPNTERVSKERVLEGYQDFDKLISTITNDNSTEYPYTLFLDHPYEYPESFYGSLEKLADLKNLGYSSLVSLSYIDEDLLLVNSFEYIFLLKCEPSDFLFQLLKGHRVNVRDVTGMDYYQFYFYTNGSTDGQQYSGLVFV